MQRAATWRIHDDGVDSWAMASAAPAAHLAGAVDRYTDYWERTGSFTARRELASTSGVLLINLGEPLEIVAADGRAIRLGRGEGFAGGLADATSISRSTGAQSGVHLHAPLETLGRILGLPPAEIVNRVVRLDEAIGREGERLGHDLAEARDADERFDRLDAFVTRRLAASPTADRRVIAAGAALRKRPETPIAALAERLNADRRAFARDFRNMLGIPPRHYARLARFEAFAAAIEADPSASLADLAADAGYYDQPHLNREVRAFAAMTPAELQRRIVPAGGGVRHE
ncbi:AraC family transcriptional regulator [Sphingomonas gilva]|uniref:AraC family transcriptional regulator n=1 Tax=Sphingomonas gilva TaxID=2305907 RepID=A0A396S304_9SPHN|nr:helix-turn-helix domain-containing protein [Sphingomonas gilva]RHW17755.1 AraC family transcriptional regulator [Sphingomonas gilva]